MSDHSERDAELPQGALSVQRPMRVLEVGTAVGFSALLMSEYLPEGAAITTIENYDKRIPIARENFRRAGEGA